MIEILIGIAIFAIIFVGVSYLLMDNLQASFDNQEKIKADFLVAEGLEAVKAIAGNDWDQIKPGTYGLKLVDNQWQLVTDSEQVTQMSKEGERIITISDVQGDNLKKVESKVVWLNITDKLKQVSAATLLTNWRNYVSVCSDGLDNDHDGFIDYPEDKGCVSPDDEDEVDPIIIPPPPPENCIDVDLDGYALAGENCGSADCDDNNAGINPGVSEVCNNNVDDNCNGLADCQEPSCAQASNCQILPPDLTCTDYDKDSYNLAGENCGQADCNDENASINPSANEICTNNIDDNCNGLIDCDDTACKDALNCQDLPPEPACIDADNDGYNLGKEGCGQADCNDNNPLINSKATEICDNGLDDNCDGLTDCQDAACSANSECQQVDPDVIFDENDTPLCKLEACGVTVTGKVILAAGQTARLQLGYYIAWPADLRTDISYTDKGLVQNNDTFSFEASWPGVRAGEEKVEIHIGAMLIDPVTGNPLMANGSSLDYYWYPWVCPAPPQKPQCSDDVDNDNDGDTDYPDDLGCQSPDDDDETDKPACSDGLDNDNDGKIDYPADSECTSPEDNDETEAVCGNGVVEKYEQCDPFAEVNVCKRTNESCFKNCACKVPICHVTESETNPYVLLWVNYHSTDGLGKNDHSHHDGDIIPIWDVDKDGILTDEDCVAYKNSL